MLHQGVGKWLACGRARGVADQRELPWLNCWWYLQWWYNHGVVGVGKAKRTQLLAFQLRKPCKCFSMLSKHGEQFWLVVKVLAGRHEQANPALLCVVAAVMKPVARRRLPKPTARFAAIEHLQRLKGVHRVWK